MFTYWNLRLNMWQLILSRSVNQCSGTFQEWLRNLTKSSRCPQSSQNSIKSSTAETGSDPRRNQQERNEPATVKPLTRRGPVGAGGWLQTLCDLINVWRGKAARQTTTRSLFITAFNSLLISSPRLDAFESSTERGQNSKLKVVKY